MKEAQIRSYERRHIPLGGEIIWWQHERINILESVKSYIERQQAGGNLFKWAGLSMAIQSVLITPLLTLIVYYTGNWTPLWFAITGSMYVTFIPVLAGLPTRQIMRVFFLNQVVSLLIIIIAVLQLLAG